jgi:hypothetical protein
LARAITFPILNLKGNPSIKKFFKDTEDDYDDKLGFELKKDKLQQEVNDLNQKKLELLALYILHFQNWLLP